MQWLTLLQKELLENWRNYKWLWVPIVITILTIMDPITNYFLPEIIESVGNLPEGAIIELPTPTTNEAVMMGLEQLGTLGILIIVLIAMGTIANERKSGVTELILTKPVRYTYYISAKWVSWNLLVWGSLLIAFFINWYYIQILYGDVSISLMLKIVFFYGLWLSFVMTVTIFYNTLFTSQGLVAFLSLSTVILLHVFSAIFINRFSWLPNNISEHIYLLIETGSIPTELVTTSLVTVSLIIGLLLLSIVQLRGQYT